MYLKMQIKKKFKMNKLNKKLYKMQQVIYYIYIIIIRSFKNDFLRK